MEAPKWFQTESDCEAIIFAYLKYVSMYVTSSSRTDDKIKNAISNMCNSLDGIYGFLLIDYQNDFFLAARDPIGVNPLFMGISHETIGFASEIKPFKEINVFHPGMFKVSEVSGGSAVFGNISSKLPQHAHIIISPPIHYRWWKLLDDVPSTELVKPKFSNLYESVFKVREILFKSVYKRLMSNVPYAVLLSGGLDSSIIAAITAKLNAKRIHTYSIGFRGSSDVINANIMAEHINSIHTTIYLEDCIDWHLENNDSSIKTTPVILDCIRNAVKYIETFDVATIRSSIPMMLMAQKIKDDGFKMVLDGDGSDEIFAGYEYFQYAPDADQLHAECVRKVKSLCRYDCKRANHAMMSASIECRCPYLDIDLIKYVMQQIDPKNKLWKKTKDLTINNINVAPTSIEKWILRMAFSDMLPESILLRSKVQFSVGCGNLLIERIVSCANELIGDDEFAHCKDTYPIKTPLSKEALLYRKIFDSVFEPDMHTIVSYEPSLNCSSIHVLDWFKAVGINTDTIDPCGLTW